MTAGYAMPLPLKMLSLIHLISLLVVLQTACAKNIPAHWKAPTTFKTSDIPQFILFTHDDNTDSRSAGYVTDVTKRHKNPNGCHINAAFYTTKQESDCKTVKKLHRAGHEIGGHSVTHRKLTKLSSREKKTEVAEVRKWLINTCGIPSSDVRGWRSPYLDDDAEIRKYIKEAGYKYDTSIPEVFNSNTSPAPGKRLWPYSLYQGIKQTQSCKYFGNINHCQKNEKYDHLFEIPMWMYQKKPYQPSTKDLMDPPNAYSVLKAELNRNYKSHRAPVGIWTHSTATNYLNKAQNRAQVSKFLRYALKKKDVWVVTPSQLLDWMQKPVKAKDMASFLKNYKCS